MVAWSDGDARSKRPPHLAAREWDRLVTRIATLPVALPETPLDRLLARLDRRARQTRP
jgi:hypothetical protein